MGMCLAVTGHVNILHDTHAGPTEMLQCTQKNVFIFVCGEGIGPELVEFGALPGPTQPQWGLGKPAAGAPLDLQ